jgi:hypothetical protein
MCAKYKNWLCKVIVAEVDSWVYKECHPKIITVPSWDSATYTSYYCYYYLIIINMRNLPCLAVVEHMNKLSKLFFKSFA